MTPLSQEHPTIIDRISAIMSDREIPHRIYEQLKTICDILEGNPPLGSVSETELSDEFGAHILEGVLGTIGDRTIGEGHVVLSEERYQWLLAHVRSLESQMKPGQDAIPGSQTIAAEESTTGDCSVDGIVSTLYRWFKSWSQRGFGPDDVTWCEVRSDVLALVRSAVPNRVAAAQATLGAGLADIAQISHQGRVGVLIRPRSAHIGYGDPGQLPAGEYWPAPDDVVLWVTGDGAGVLTAALRAAEESHRGQVP